MTELEAALSLANMILDRPNADPDDDLALLSRQLIRQVERIDRLTDDLADAQARRDEAERERDALRGLDPAGTDELMERWNQTDPAIQRAIVARFAGLLNEARDECVRIRQRVRGMADRIAAQAELLARRAERPKEGDDE